jgi:anti-repressor protein
MNGIQVFRHELLGEIRTLLIDGAPWFVGVDSCKMLGIANSRDALAKLDDDEKKTVALTDGKRGNPNLTIISEAGLYTLVLSSRKPEARVFKRWITHDVIPAIRKHGVYATPAVIEQALTNPDSLIRILTALKDERALRIATEQKAEALTTQLVEAQPKIQFADDIAVSQDAILIREFAKLACNAGYPMGGRRMWSWLREHGILMKDDRDPYQKYIDAGWFVV